MISEDVFRWIIGIVLVSTVLGGIVSFLWYQLLAKIFRVKREFTKLNNILIKTGIITGIIERAFFAIAIAANLGGTTIAMVVWTTLKSNTVWKSFFGQKIDNLDQNRVGVSILASLGSMVIAIIAGKICDKTILVDTIETLRISVYGLN